MTQQKKIAVVLFNLGGPTSSDAIRPFLINFFMDKNIIPFWPPVRYGFARMIAFLRGRKGGPAHTAYHEMGGKSPLLENTLAQAEALREQLKELGDVRVYTCMRYWHPMADSVVPQVQSFAPDELVLLSLYPQLSSTTFWSSFQVWQNVCKKLGYHKAPTVLCCYPAANGFVTASVDLLRRAIEQCRNATGILPRVLFSAHSIPVKLVEKGDPYDAQCKMTVAAILQELNISGLDAVQSYQSKVGPQDWLGPQTEDEIKRAGNDKVPLLVYPHAFVSEHVETIVELGVEYKHVAEEHGVPYYNVVPTVGTHPDFIAGLAQQVRARLGQAGIFSDSADGDSICPPEAVWCCQRRAKVEKIVCCSKEKCSA